MQFPRTGVVGSNVAEQNTEEGDRSSDNCNRDFGLAPDEEIGELVGGILKFSYAWEESGLYCSGDASASRKLVYGCIHRRAKGRGLNDNVQASKAHGDYNAYFLFGAHLQIVDNNSRECG